MNNRQSNVKQEWGQRTDWYLDGIPIAFFETVPETETPDTAKADQPAGETKSDDQAQAENKSKS